MSWYLQQHDPKAADGGASVQQAEPIFRVCIFTANGEPFLFEELDIPLTRPEFVLPLTVAEAAALLAAGVPRCTVRTTLPEVGLGAGLELTGVFTVNGQTFAVFRIFVSGTGATVDKVLVATSEIPVVPRVLPISAA